MIVFAQKYMKDVGIGTLISLMLPYAIAFAVVRIPMLLVWIWAGLPLGIEGLVFYELLLSGLPDLQTLPSPEPVYYSFEVPALPSLHIEVIRADRKIQGMMLS